MKPTRSPRAGGMPLAFGILAGTVVGLLLGEPSAGLLAGFGIGLAVAIAIWLVDRRRGS